jgi:hypothetical protein
MVHVIESVQYERPSYDEMTAKVADIVTRICQDQPNVYVFVDAANPSFVSSIKQAIGEDPHYTEYVSKLRAKKQAGDQDQYLKYYMRVIPVSFGQRGISLLQKAQQFMQLGHFAIHPTRNDELILALRSATAQDYRLDKEVSINNDLLDSLRLCLHDLSLVIDERS